MPKTDGLISLPMYAKYSRLRLDQIPMTRLLLDMHEPYNRDHIKFLKDSMQTILEFEGLKDQYTIFTFNDILDNSVKVSLIFAWRWSSSPSTLVKWSPLHAFVLGIRTSFPLQFNRRL